MLWSDGCSYNGGAVSAACAPLAPGDTSYLDAYDAGSHHASVNMDYDTHSTAWLYHSRNPNGRLVIYHHGFASWFTDNQWFIDRLLVFRIRGVAGRRFRWRVLLPIDDSHLPPRVAPVSLNIAPATSKLRHVNQ